ncbi:ADP-ribosylglycohydrolase family protein [Lacticaseibacillus rhamnosus]|nr:ADP-ribosylglycohydrolase family protein [Lacticaseibacillus rhamnosus]
MRTLDEKLLGTLTLAAIGDAMGSVTENMPFDKIRKEFGGSVTTFLKPGKTAFAFGNEAGQITDDFSQLFLVSKEILNNKGVISSLAVKKAMLKWADMPQYFNRFAGPTTRSAIAMYRSSEQVMEPLEGAVTVDYASKATNGAAMKIAAAGMFNPDDIDSAIKSSVIMTKVTHDNSLAISGSAAVAAATSVSYKDDVSFDDLIDAGFYGAKVGLGIGKEESHYVAGPDVSARMQLAITIVDGPGTKNQKLLRLANVVGSGLHISEAVPCAFGLVRLNQGNPLQAVIDAVNIGYDTDTIATIVGSMVGGLQKMTDQISKMLNQLETANGLNIRQLAIDIAASVEDQRISAS